MFMIFLLNLKIYIHTKEVKYILIDLLLCQVSIIIEMNTQGWNLLNWKWSHDQNKEAIA